MNAYELYNAPYNETMDTEYCIDNEVCPMCGAKVYVLSSFGGVKMCAHCVELEKLETLN